MGALLPSDAPIPAFDFESLIDWWVARGDALTGAPEVRTFLESRAREIVDHLPDDQLPWALAAWQREGERLYGMRQLHAAHRLYTELAEFLEDNHPLAAHWCAGARAECLIQMGEVEEGVAVLVDLLDLLIEEEYQPGIESVLSAIEEASALLGLPTAQRPFAMDRPAPPTQVKSPFEP